MDSKNHKDFEFSLMKNSTQFDHSENQHGNMVFIRQILISGIQVCSFCENLQNIYKFMQTFLFV